MIRMLVARSDFRGKTRRCFVHRQLLQVLGGVVVALLLPGCVVQAQEPPTLDATDRVLVVVGAAGADEYTGEFSQWADAWRQLAMANQWEFQVIGEQTQDVPPTALDALKAAIADHKDVETRLWIVLLGHGTYAKGIAKFNLVGPDVSAGDLKRWLTAVRSEVVIVNCSSASAPFLPELSGPKRVVVTATRAGTETNYARFGKYLAAAIGNPQADIDHDDSVSLLEAYLAATAATERFYFDEARLATEHALLEDNGDRIGTPGDFFQGVHPVRSSQEGKVADGRRAARIILYTSDEVPKLTPEQVKERETIETAIDQLRQQKSVLAEEEYYRQLEELLLRLARLYKSTDQ
ncbi:MAG: hypothetical protein R3C53_26495 [Pirellulaceae bacterium]